MRCWLSCEINEQILVWFHCDGEEPSWTVPEQKEITNEEWVYRGRTEHFINAHIEVMLSFIKKYYQQNTEFVYNTIEDDMTRQQDEHFDMTVL